MLLEVIEFIHKHTKFIIVDVVLTFLNTFKKSLHSDDIYRGKGRQSQGQHRTVLVETSRGSVCQCHSDYRLLFYDNVDPLAID